MAGTATSGQTITRTAVRLDYCSFGMVEPGRSYNIVGDSSYRFGYQGSMKDNDIYGVNNAYTTKNRELDDRLGRWWSIDPKVFPWQSPYVSMNDNPILNNDIFGDEVDVSGTKKEKRQFIRALNKTTGNKYGIDKEGKLYNKGGYANLKTDKNKSGELSQTVEQAIGLTDKIAVNLVNNDKGVAFDQYSTGKLDIGDFTKAPQPFQAGMFGHVFAERMNTPGGYENPDNRNDAGFATGHQAGLETETRIVGAMLGLPTTLRTTTDVPIFQTFWGNDGTGTIREISNKQVYNYGTVEYDVINGVTHIPLNDGSGLSKAINNIGDIQSIYQK